MTDDNITAALYDGGLRTVDAALIQRNSFIAQAVAKAAREICDDYRSGVNASSVASAVAGSLLVNKRVNQELVGWRLGFTPREFQRLMLRRPALRAAYRKAKKELA